MVRLKTVHPVVYRMSFLYSSKLSSGSVIHKRHVCPRKCWKTTRSSLLSITGETEVRQNLFEGYWYWEGHKIRYQRSGDSGAPVVLIHGFGGNCDHWRKNTGALGEKHRVYAIDLLGYGYSDKPDPSKAPPNSIYCFPRWGQQVVQFIDEVVQAPAVLSCNSVGGLAGLEAAILSPEAVKAVQVINMSLRGLHVQRTNPLVRPVIAAFQQFLRTTTAGPAFFRNVATRKTVRDILLQAYARKDAVTDELVDVILKPGLTQGAPQVFLDFISYSGGPLPEDLLDKCPVPVSIIWGVDDPWEDIKLGKALFGSKPCVEEFIELLGVGHCPQDEAPELVNPLIEAFTLRHGAWEPALREQR